MSNRVNSTAQARIAHLSHSFQKFSWKFPEYMTVLARPYIL